MRTGFVGWAGLATLGALVTAFWLARGETAALISERPVELSLMWVGVCALTVANLLLRWLRWHFLTRTLDVRLKVRDSIGLYFSTLPAILTPLYLGEILRGVVLSRRYPRARQAVVWIWFIERLLDASILALFWLLSQAEWTLASLGILALLGVAWVSRRVTGADLPRDAARATPYPLYAGVLLASTLVSWSLPIAALWGVIHGLGDSSSLATAARAWSQGTLLGGVTGIPLGTGVTGSTAIVVLRSAGIADGAAATAIALVRAGTAWFAAALGLAVLWRWKGQLRDLFLGRENPYHFDVIASDYAEQIPAHIRDRLLSRKVAILQQRLRDAGLGEGARGLDLGCGQGWYASEMAAAGFDMVGVDRSPAQIEKAREHAASRGVEVEFQSAAAADLEFRDESFDFVYAINVVHHITDVDERRHALSEIVRVLKTGGGFYMHEMNTENPAFLFYLSYVFPLIKDIDEGDELWVRPTALPEVDGAKWETENDYFNFLPDILPLGLLDALTPVERWLERSRFRHLSAHYLARLTRR